jgi:hypothetical protein
MNLVMNVMKKKSQMFPLQRQCRDITMTLTVLAKMRWRSAIKIQADYLSRYSPYNTAER